MDEKRKVEGLGRMKTPEEERIERILEGGRAFVEGYRRWAASAERMAVALDEAKRQGHRLAKDMDMLPNRGKAI